MSALGQKQTFPRVRLMSALPPKADINKRRSDVRFVPEADIGRLPLLGPHGHDVIREMDMPVRTRVQ
jgi:hypothetical protein